MELRNAVQDTQSQLETMSLSLAEYKHRALQAEVSILSLGIHFHLGPNFSSAGVGKSSFIFRAN
jgi:hypothetical protein